MSKNTKELRTREAELIEELLRISAEINDNRHNIAEEIKGRLNYIENTKNTGYNEVELPDTDIYNTNDLLEEVYKPQQPERTLKEIKYLGKVYVTTPFADKELTRNAIKVLEELKPIEEELEKQHNNEIKKAKEEVKKAQNRLNAAISERQHFRSGFRKMIRPFYDALNKREIDESTLRRAGIFSKYSFSVADHATFSAPEIISGYISAIEAQSHIYENRKKQSLERKNTPPKITTVPKARKSFWGF